MFKKNDWIKKDTVQFLKHHNIIPIKEVHVTKNYYRYRLVEPDYRDGVKFRIITISPYPEIKAVIYYKISK
jgi:hypothetical protein